MACSPPGCCGRARTPPPKTDRCLPADTARRNSTGARPSGIYARRCCGALFQQLSDPGRLQPLGLVEVLDWTAAALNLVDRAVFFARFTEGEAVPYFYEPFLEAFDPELRKELGVWYTPPEVVRYICTSRAER